MPWDSGLGSRDVVEIAQGQPESETQNLKVELRLQAAGVDLVFAEPGSALAVA